MRSPDELDPVIEILQQPSSRRGVRKYRIDVCTSERAGDYAYAKAKAEREGANRLSWFFEHPEDPTASKRAALLGIQDYGKTPDGFATTDQTLRRGQDMSSADERYKADATSAAARYGSDRVYEASTSNNVRDNARAIEDRRMQEESALVRQMAGPIKLAQGERAYLPSQTAAATGLPGQLDGAAKPLSSDEVFAATLDAMPSADKQRITQNKFAPTETQVQGRALQQRFDNNDITPQMQVERYQGQETPVEVIGPDGKPAYMSPGAAVALGAQPYKTPSAASKPELQNWIGPNGSGGGTAIYDAASGQWQDTTTRRPLPAGSRTYTGQLQGGADATGLGPTTSNATEATRLESSLDQAQALVGGIRSILSQNKNVAGVPGRLKASCKA